MVQKHKVACLFDYHQWSEEMPYWCVICNQRNPKYKYALWTMNKTVNTRTVKMMTHAQVHSALIRLDRYNNNKVRVCDLGSCIRGKDWAARLEVYGFVTASQGLSNDYGGKIRRMISLYELTETGMMALELLNEASVKRHAQSLVSVPVKIDEKRLKFFQCHRW